ncbi:hypothetical protein IFM89_016045 [Coptis chinensis]|uniref:Uncharacterized protein n=1 Tax=Coptis chinensis TaxID=261450 RepID=A0A835H5Q4_9MAGN|nr:hypothetical protein IFM89_016045 [Coptis chinensis]
MNSISHPENGYMDDSLSSLDSDKAMQDLLLTTTQKEGDDHLIEFSEAITSGLGGIGLGRPQASSNAPTKKLGLMRWVRVNETAIPSIFHEEDEDEDEDDGGKDKKMRPLVPIDYSTGGTAKICPNSRSGHRYPNLGQMSLSSAFQMLTEKKNKMKAERDQ